MLASKYGRNASPLARTAELITLMMMALALIGAVSRRPESVCISSSRYSLIVSENLENLEKRVKRSTGLLLRGQISDLVKQHQAKRTFPCDSCFLEPLTDAANHREGGTADNWVRVRQPRVDNRSDRCLDMRAFVF